MKPGLHVEVSLLGTRFVRLSSV